MYNIIQPTKVSESSGASSGNDDAPPHSNKIPYNIVNNYFSIGVVSNCGGVVSCCVGVVSCSGGVVSCCVGVVSHCIGVVSYCSDFHV